MWHGGRLVVLIPSSVRCARSHRCLVVRKPRQNEQGVLWTNETEVLPPLPPLPPEWDLDRSVSKDKGSINSTSHNHKRRSTTTP